MWLGRPVRNNDPVHKWMQKGTTENNKNPCCDHYQWHTLFVGGLSQLPEVLCKVTSNLVYILRKASTFLIRQGEKIAPGLKLNYKIQQC